MLSEIILGGLVFLVALLAWLLHGATNNRLRDKEDELDDWNGTLDVRRRVRDELDNDPQYTDRVQDEFNDK